MIEIKKQLDAVGPGFCLAKYTDLSLHLETGHAHSCVHPRTHHIPVDEVLADPGALHNPSYKIEIRQQALDQQKPKECGYCWNMESVGDTAVFSDRIYFSSPFMKDLASILSKGPAGQHYPHRLEISFSTTCNFKCAYCGPEVSSMWMRDLEQHGSIPTSSNRYSLESIQENKKIPIPDRDHNPYIEAFWQWIPDAYQHLRSLRITGGEPLLNHNTFRVIEWIKNNPNPMLDFGINTNLGVPEKLISRSIKELNSISSRSLRSMTIWTSGESAGRANSYARLGGDYPTWLRNMNQILESSSSINVRIMTTYNLLSVTTYGRFLNDIAELKSAYPGRVILDTHTYLQFPRYLTIDILTEDFYPYIEQQVEKIKSMAQSRLSTEHEIFMAERLKKYFAERMLHPWPDTRDLRRDFFIFIQQFDRRNNSNFVDSFPEMIDFYKLCEKSNG